MSVFQDTTARPRTQTRTGCLGRTKSIPERYHGTGREPPSGIAQQRVGEGKGRKWIES